MVLIFNMGCPDRSIEKQGAGAAMIKDFDKAGKLFKLLKMELIIQKRIFQFL